MSDWLILGAGGHARVVHDVIVRLGHRVVAVAGQARGATWDVPVVDDDDEALVLAARTGAAVAVAVGGDRLRLDLLRRVLADGLAAPPVVATTATVAPSASLGPGTVVLEHAHVGPAAVVGDAVVVNTAAVVEHDTRLGNGCHIAPGAVVLGGGSVGETSLLGSGARVLPGIHVGGRVTVGAGAVVADDVADDTVVVGVPARPLGPRR